MSSNPVVGIIGGMDSSGAAGLAVDIKAMTCLGIHPAPIVTALTAQTLTHVNKVECVDPWMIKAQLEAFMELRSSAVIKVGMLGSEAVVKALSDCLGSTHFTVIVDPVLRASAGRALLDAGGLKSLRRDLMPLVTLLTPNIPEAETLTGIKVDSPEAMRRAACRLQEMGPKAVVIKGGHGSGWSADDFVVDDQGEFWLSSVRQPQSVRGTGCAFASVVAAAMASGHELRDALVMAKGYLARGISRSSRIHGDRPRVLFHDHWPVRQVDFPTVSFGSEPEIVAHFPTMGPGSIGFYPIVPRASWVRPLAELGVKTMQLRIKDLAGDRLDQEIAAAIDTARSCGTQLFINDYWELALKYEAFGVHLGQEDLATADLNMLRSSGLRLGVSTHSYFEAAVAHGLRPSYVALGPIFPTTCKSMRFGPQGFGRVSEWRTMLPYPLVAIGGLRPEHADVLRERGADGLAVISDWLHHPHPQLRVQEWLNRTVVNPREERRVPH